MAKLHTVTEAKVAGGALVISFHGDAPRVWRSDMGGLGSAVFELKDAADKTALVVKKPSGPEEIFVYADKPSAAAGLQAVTAALFSADSSTGAPVTAAHPKKSSLAGRIFKWVVFLLLGFICFVIAVSSLLPKPAGMSRQPGTGAVETSKGTGVPLPADQVLGK